MSQLLARLEREFASATDLPRRVEIGAQLAGNLARMGRFDRAKQLIVELRQACSDGRGAQAVLWIMLAEGLIHLYEDLSPQALDRINRAQLLGLALKQQRLVAIASAWKAHIEFETSHFAAMGASLQVVRENANDDDLDALTRYSIVLMNSFLLCGAHEEARRWFTQGREYALKNGDQASIEALLYNWSSFGFAWLRVQSCLSTYTERELTSIRMQIQSARNLQELMGITALTNHIHLWESRLHISEGNYSRAVERLEIVRGLSPFADYNFSQELIDLEIAFCLFQDGRVEQALKRYEGGQEISFESLDIDDQLVAAWMRHRLSDVDPRFGDKKTLRAKFDRLASAYLQSQLKLEQVMESFVQH